MATLYSELTAYCTANKIPIPPKSQRITIGLLIAEEFRNCYGKIPIPKIKSEEVVFVNSYPDNFAKVMTHIIEVYLKNPTPPPKKDDSPLQEAKPAPPSTKKRKRIPIKS